MKTFGISILRGLTRSPSFTIVAVATLAMGIGVNATLFSLADAVMFRPFPFAQQDRLVIAGEDQTATRSEVSYANFIDWRARARVFDGLAAMGSSNWTFTLLADDPVPVLYRAVSGNFFDVLGMSAALGRTFTPADDQRGATRVVVISHGLWQRQFGGRREVIGQPITLDRKPFTIVGVLPRAFTYPAGADAWIPLAPALAAVRGPGMPDVLGDRDIAVLHVVGRMKPGVDVKSARADLNRIIAELAATYGRTERVSARVGLLVEDLLGAARPGLWALLAAVGLLLLVASANVAGLLLVQMAVRGREYAIRMALGASHLAIARQLLWETLLLAGVAAVAGILVARAAVPIVLTFVPPEIPRLDETTVDARVIAFAMSLAVLATLVCWIAPAVHLAGTDLDLELRRAGRAVASGGLDRRARRFLVVAEIAMAIVLLTCAGLLYRSVRGLEHIDLGFEPDGLLAVDMDLPDRIDASSHRAVAQFYSRAIADLATVPLVESVGSVGSRPLKGLIGLDSSWQLEGQDRHAAQNNPWVNTEVVTPTYFRVMQTPLLAGRLFDDRDGAPTQPVIIVNHRLAQWAWPNSSPIGKRLRVAALDGARTPSPWWTVVGVVADVRYRELTSVPLDVYVPLEQAPFSAGDLMARTRAPASAVAPAIRARLRQMNPEGAVSLVRMDDVVRAHQAPWRANLVFFGFFAGVTVVLAVIGLYATLAATVVDQSREIGVRLTLGATGRRILADVLVDGGRLALIGAAVGVIVSIAGARLVRALLFEVSPADTLTLAAAPLVLLVVALVACAVPAIRATRVDPAVTLRSQ